MAIHFMHYNFCRVHQTLRIEARANKFGAQGWELATAAGVGVYGNYRMVFCFECPVGVANSN